MVGSTPSSRPEYTPLLSVGRHEVSLHELHQLCVDRFPLSTTRKRIMEGLEKVIKRLNDNGIQGEIWINGSFVTEKINPNDVDIVLRMNAEIYERGTDEQRQTVDWLQMNLKDDYLCDSYCFMEYPQNHPNYRIGQCLYSYWMKQFGFSRGNEMKGIAVIAILGGTK